jgi:hypothetical protein
MLLFPENENVRRVKRRRSDQHLLSGNLVALSIAKEYFWKKMQAFRHLFHRRVPRGRGEKTENLCVLCELGGEFGRRAEQLQKIGKCQDRIPR